MSSTNENNYENYSYDKTINPICVGSGCFVEKRGDKIFYVEKGMRDEDYIEKYIGNKIIYDNEFEFRVVEEK